MRRTRWARSPPPSWGATHSRRVTWLPGILDDEGLSGADQVFVAWDTPDDPPVHARVTNFGQVAFVAAVATAAGHTSHAITAYEATSVDDLTDGSYVFLD